MSIIIRLQNLPLEANSLDIRRFFQGLQIPDGGVHIVGGENGDAFIAFANDEDARQAMERNGNIIKGSRIKLLLSSRNEMQRVIDAARNQTISIMPQTALSSVAVAVASVTPTKPQMISGSVGNIGSNMPMQQQQQQQPPQLVSQKQLQPPIPQQQQHQQQQQPLHPGNNYPTQQQQPQYPATTVQHQQPPQPLSNPTGGYYPGSMPVMMAAGGVGVPSQIARYPPPPSSMQSQQLSQSSQSTIDYHRGPPQPPSTYGHHRQNDRQELQSYRRRSRSRSRSPPSINRSEIGHQQRYSSDQIKSNTLESSSANTMQTGLMRSLQPSSQPQTLIGSNNNNNNNNNLDPRYSTTTNYTQQLSQQQQQESSYGSSYRQQPNIMPGVSNNTNTIDGDRDGIITGIGQQQQQRGWNDNNNGNNNNNYRQTSVVDYNNRKMDSIHQPPMPQSSAYGQLPPPPQQQQQQSTMMIPQSIRQPQPQQQQPQPPPPQQHQMFTLQLNDLPFNVKSIDLIKFFQPLFLDEDNIKIFYDSKGFPTGIALVRFGSPKEWEQALTYNNRYLCDRRIQVQPLDDIGNNNNNGNGNGPSMTNQSNTGPLLQQPPLIANPPLNSTGGQRPLPPQSDPYRDNNNYYRNPSEEIGLPFANCTTKDVAHFFDPIKLFHIEIEFDNRSKPTGNAFVEFHDRQDVDHAMSYNMRNMGHRYIELIPWLFTPDLKQFFAKSNIDTYAVHIMLTTDKMNAGEAFVEFLTKDDQNRALDMSGSRLLGERINIRPVAYEIVRSSVPPPRQQPSMLQPPPPPPSSSSKSGGGKFGGGGGGRRGPGPRTNQSPLLVFDKSLTLIMKNLSHKTNVDDLCRFFNDYHITPNRIKIRPSIKDDDHHQSSSNDSKDLDIQQLQQAQKLKYNFIHVPMLNMQFVHWINNI
ncbi:rna-binding protein-like protein 2 [Dermatophagoides farinae]|uniref:Rna-binding protein-like protein 2 n=1 Tax=Dermatophagoides farinae TaxID=6954 RepID=A0A9D4SEB1_DERFA|nr:rna-binding protein-like protein 2 [Dermatophagoides farinae]